jgi:DNA-directed RNA polymerase specialized sigma24 family protein
MMEAPVPVTPGESGRRIRVEDRCDPKIVERLIREFEPYLKRLAVYIAADFPAAARDMVQEARITLWELDVGRFTQADERYLARILCTCMIHVYRGECRGGLTSGWSKKAVSLPILVTEDLSLEGGV